MAKLEGDKGDNTISGTSGDDHIDGEGGDDDLSGGGDDDHIKGDDGNDTLSGGTGDDKIDGDDGNDSITGDAGRDHLKGGKGDDTIFGGAHDDKIKGEDGDDQLDGGTGNDKIDGDKGCDLLRGGAGDDTLDGSKGRDTIEGGTGDDRMSGGKDADTFVIRDGHGNDTIKDFDEDEDVIAFDMDEIQSYQDVRDRMTSEGKETVITYDNGDRVTLSSTDIDKLTAANFTFDAGPICFHAGTLILTPTGPRPVEGLHPGDLVITADHGPQPVLWRSVQRLRFRRRDDPAKPVLITRGALGNGLPNADLIVSPQHRLALTGPDGTEVLMAAVKLLPRAGMRRMRGRDCALYHNLLLDGHHLIFANGCRAETLLLTAFTRRRLRDAAALPPHVPPMPPARQILRL